jgi:peptide/nickel transport system substrate-binding protein
MSMTAENSGPHLVSRRRFLSLAAAVSTATTMVSLLAQPSVAAAAVVAAQPTSGALRVGVPGQIRNLDPARINSQEEAVLVNNIFEQLVQQGPDRVIKPQLAESWKVSDDLKSWTLALRKGAKFQHGREVVADDVVATVERILDPKTAAYMRSSIDMIGTVAAVDPYTVQVNLKYGYPELLNALSDPNLAIVPSDKIDSLSDQPIGSGPFMLKDFVPGGSVSLVANPNYTGTPAALASVTLQLIPEAAVQTTSIKNGEVDILFRVPFEIFDDLNSADHVVVSEVASQAWDPLVMDTRNPPFSDPKVRLAVRYAVDKDELIKLSLFGHGVKVPFPLAPENPLFPKDVPDVPVDLARAKQLLTEAGYPDGFETTMLLGVGREQRVREGVAISEMLKAINIQCTIQQLPLDKFFADVEFKGDFYTDGWSEPPGTDLSVYPYFHSTGSWNVGHWKNDQADAILAQTRQTTSVDERRRLYGELGKLINEDSPYMIAWVANRASAWRDNVVGYQTHPIGWAFFQGVSLNQ